jgi:hypothetical protein
VTIHPATDIDLPALAALWHASWHRAYDALVEPVFATQHDVTSFAARLPIPGGSTETSARRWSRAS